VARDSFGQAQADMFFNQVDGRKLTIIGGNHTAAAYKINRSIEPNNQVWQSAEVLIYNHMNDELVSD
jgi:hypothetical protein